MRSSGSAMALEQDPAPTLKQQIAVAAWIAQRKVVLMKRNFMFEGAKYECAAGWFELRFEV